MAKKSVVARQAKRELLTKKYGKKVKELQDIAKNKSLPMDAREDAMKKLWSLPRDAHLARLRNRCVLTGRPRGVFRRFKICRHKIRELMAAGLIAGLEKSSW